MRKPKAQNGVLHPTTTTVAAAAVFRCRRRCLKLSTITTIIVVVIGTVIGVIITVIVYSVWVRSSSASGQYLRELCEASCFLGCYRGW